MTQKAALLPSLSAAPFLAVVSVSKLGQLGSGVPLVHDDAGGDSMHAFLLLVELPSLRY